MFEILNRRKHNSKTFDNGDGTQTIQSHAREIHYKDSEKAMREINLSLEDMGTYWKMVKASYNVYIAKDFDADDLIRFDNVYKGANHKIYYEPKMLAWVNNPDMSDMQVFRNQQSVQGEITRQTPHATVIRYTDAFGDGIHFEITLNRYGFKKEIVIEAKNKLELPPTVNHKLVALFRYKGDGLKIKSKDKLREWNKLDYFEEEGGFTIQEADVDAPTAIIGVSKKVESLCQTFISPAFIIDSSPRPKMKLIKVFWKLHNGALWQAKVLSKTFLQAAVYPVRADTVTSFYPDANADTDTLGKVGTSYPPAGTTQKQSGAYCEAGCFRYATSNYSWYIHFATIYTGGLGDGTTLVSGSVSLWMENREVSQTAYYSVYDSTHSDAIATADWSEAGTTELTTARTGVACTDDQYNDFVLNTAGLAHINKTGYTKICIRDKTFDYDLDRTTPTAIGYAAYYFTLADDIADDVVINLTFTGGSSLLTDLEHAWRLDGNSLDAIGSITSTDYNIVYSTANGKILQGMGCNGSSSYIYGSASARPTGEWTWAFWINMSSFASDEYFMTGFNYQQGLQVNGATANRLTFRSYLSTYTEIENDTDLSTDTWYLCVVTYDETNMRMYIDGSLDSTPLAYGGLGSGTDESWFGCWNPAQAADFGNGKLDEIFLWSRALTATEVETLYNGGDGLPFPFQGGIAASGNFFQLF